MTPAARKSRAKERIEVDLTEYDALRFLCDVTHERTVAQLDALTAINREQVSRLTRADLSLREYERQIEALGAELVALRKLAPVLSTVPQPLFARGPRGGG